MDYDWLIVGSGFGGSVSALRLAEKGYRVAVLEAGRRFRDEDFAKSTWNLRRYLWLPAAGLRGILRLTPFSDAFITTAKQPTFSTTRLPVIRQLQLLLLPQQLPSQLTTTTKTTLNTTVSPQTPLVQQKISKKKKIKISDSRVY